MHSTGQARPKNDNSSPLEDHSPVKFASLHIFDVFNCAGRPENDTLFKRAYRQPDFSDQASKLIIYLLTTNPEP